MGWRNLVHRLGFDMTRHIVFSKGEARMEVWTAPDGETLEHAELYRFGELVDQEHDDHGEIVTKIHSWLGGGP